MNEETRTIIQGYPEISMDDARLIFIRQRGREDWKSRTSDISSLITVPAPVKDAPRDQVIAYIGFLETMTRELRAYTQGLKMEYSKEIEPEIAEHHKETEAKKDSKRSAPRTLEGMLSKLGMTKEQFVAALKDREKK